MSSPSPAVESGPAPKDSIQVNSCGLCSDCFSYTIPSGQTAKILIRIPPEGIKYKAISHVWGGTPCLINIFCRHCEVSTRVPLRTPHTLHNIMALAEPGGGIWLDNMSINQSDIDDVNSQLAVMGDIYGGAECVSVLLPPSDQEAYRTIADLVERAAILLKRKGQFDFNPEDEIWKPELGEEIKATGDLARSFCLDIQKLQSDLPQYTYWCRAWTFQEWARAQDVEMAVDKPRDVSCTLPVRHKVKSTIVHAAIMIADYKLRHGDYALMKLGLSRGEIKPFLDSIKRLFPFEDAFAIDEEISKYKLRFQIGMPNQGTDAILGLRPVPRPPRTADAQFRARLNLMLDAFTGSTIRNATHDADLVCCWASMCKIKYKYSPTDTLPVAFVRICQDPTSGAGYHMT